MKRFAIVLTIVALIVTGVVTVNADSNAQDTVARSQTDETAWLGVQVGDSDAGVVIRAVASDSPADDAGLRRGDVITMVDDTAVESAGQLVELIQTYAPGDEVTLTVTWRGESREVAVTLAARPDDVAFAAPGMIEIRPGAMANGQMMFMGLEAELTDDGLLVKSIVDGSPLADSGLQEGDLITAINGEPAAEFFPGMMMGRFRDESAEVVFTVLRSGEELEITATLDWPMMGQFEVMPFEGVPFEGVPFEGVPFEGVPFEGNMPMFQRPTQLGVEFRTLTEENAGDLPASEGALIVTVYENTPAAEAGLLVDDIITAVDGDVVDVERTLADRLVAYEAGDVVTLTVLRDGEEIEVQVTLGARGRVMAPFGFSVQPGFRNGPGMRQGRGFFFGMPGMRQGRGFFFGMPDMMPGQGFFFGMPFGQEFFDAHPFLTPDEGGSGSEAPAPAPDAGATTGTSA